jgi:hypothetical protein
VKHLCVLLAVAFLLPAAVAREVWLGSLDLGHVRQGRGKARANRSVQGSPISIGGAGSFRGVGTHAESGFSLRLE